METKLDSSTIILNSLEFLDSSPVERNSTRIKPKQSENSSLLYEGKEILSGLIVSISENSIALEASCESIELLSEKHLWDIELSLNLNYYKKRLVFTV